MRINVKNLIEKHIKLIESGKIHELFLNANARAFKDDEIDELIDILENTLEIPTLEIRKQLFGELFKQSLLLFDTGSRIELADHLNGMFYNILGLSTDDIVDVINSSDKAYVDHNYVMEIL